MSEYLFIGGPWHRESRIVEGDPYRIKIPDPEAGLLARHGLAERPQGYYNKVVTDSFLGTFYVYGNSDLATQLVTVFEENRPKTCQERIENLEGELKYQKEVSRYDYDSWLEDD